MQVWSERRRWQDKKALFAERPRLMPERGLQAAAAGDRTERVARKRREAIYADSVSSSVRRLNPSGEEEDIHASSSA